MREIARMIWDASEYLNIPLGPLAPYVFGIMIGSFPRKVKKSKKS